ncbi:hypothetical protein COV19_05835 [Candidatus Woesearchaeota archaeon CG10_big_fil_rev_8_21_14_0_10_44_13]|nr:MAG: hypothetical protein COV19_05835 [Candidatus Woesearchaeota archaeon CG10_big_fil_rev_8_21_14_0_10_44_13]
MAKGQKPAILGGKAAFSEILPITKPTMPEFSRLIVGIRKILESGMITNSTYVAEFEKETRSVLGVKNAVALSSCTSGLMLLMKAMKLKGEVILPSFTFSATGHSVIWNNLKPVFVDVDPESYLIDPELVNEAITDKTSLILGVHLFGHPCDVKALGEIARDNNLRLIYDAAHAFGSKVGKEYVGNFGDAESFSLSPTKLVTAAEGGMVTTNDDETARLMKLGRTYGDNGTLVCEYGGLSARMSEINGLLGLRTLQMVEKNVLNRNKLADIYKKELKGTPGIKYQKIREGVRSTFKDFSIYIDEKEFGLDRDRLAEALAKENIIARKYFYPPLHEQPCYGGMFRHYNAKLPVTNDVSRKVLSLPLYSHLSVEDVKKVSACVRSIHENASEIRKVIK